MTKTVVFEGRELEVQPTVEELEAEIDRLRAENAELREALSPFAVDHGPHGAFFQPSALAAARAILAKTAKEGK